jgi:hypothetical protein
MVHGVIDVRRSGARISDDLAQPAADRDGGPAETGLPETLAGGTHAGADQGPLETQADQPHQQNARQPAPPRAQDRPRHPRRPPVY